MVQSPGCFQCRVRVCEYCPPDRNKVYSALSDRFIGKLGIFDAANTYHWDLNRLLDFFRQGQEVSLRLHTLGPGSDEPAGYIDHCDSCLYKFPGESLVLADCVSILTTIVRAQTVEQRKLRADGLPNLVDDFEWESNSILECATVLVSSSIAQQGRELVQQATVHTMNLYSVKPRLECASSSLTEHCCQAANLVLSQLPRDFI
jgi:hypothetical protein